MNEFYTWINRFWDEEHESLFDFHGDSLVLPEFDRQKLGFRELGLEARENRAAEKKENVTVCNIFTFIFLDWTAQIRLGINLMAEVIPFQNKEKHL